MKRWVLLLLMGCMSLAQAAGSEMRNLAYGPDPLQQLDVYLPEGARKAPVILMLHGGGWKRGGKTMDRVVTDKVAHWVPRGVIVVSANYRLLPEHAPDVQVEDVARALAFVQKEAPRWGGDPQRVVLMGHSAGGHLVALLGVLPALQARMGAQPPVAVVPLDSGAIDLVSIMRDRHFRLYDDAFGRNPAYWEQLSPLHQLRVKTVPYLLVCSSKRAVPCREAERFADKARQLGGQAQVLPQALSHGDINGKLGEPGAYTEAVDRFLLPLMAP